jgi:ubiquinone/menaquinone biosynthesis C-methylase UbiE
MGLYKLLEKPFCYRMVVKLFSMGGRARKINGFMDQLMAGECRGRVLEVGSGTSQFRDMFLKYVDNYVVTDINFEYVRYSKSSHPNLWHVQCDAALLPFAGAAFDRVFSLYLFHHLSDGLALNCLKEMRAALKPGGKIVIVDLFQTEKRWDLVSRGVSWLDRGEFVRPRAAMRDLIKAAGDFQVEEHHHVPGEWPYSMSVFILEP